MSTPSRPKPWSKLLPDEDSKIGRALAGGSLQSLAVAVMQHKSLSVILLQVLDTIGAVCTTLCRRSLPSLSCNVTDVLLFTLFGSEAATEVTLLGLKQSF